MTSSREGVQGQKTPHPARRLYDIKHVSMQDELRNPSRT
jgi:hypothetical protein